MISLHARPLEIPFRTAFQQASKYRTSSESVLVLAEREGARGIGEGCPRDYQTGETLASALDWIASMPALALHDVAALHDWISTSPAPPAARCAVETAVLDLLAREAGLSVETLLDRPAAPTRFRYTTVLGMNPGPAVLDRLVPMQIEHLKLKVGLDPTADRALLGAVRQRVPHARIHLDANNAFGHDEQAAMRHLGALLEGGSGFWAVEEPLLPGRPEATAAIGRALGVPMILDEAVGSPADLRAHAEHPAEWIVNIKVSRCGGVLRSLALAEQARAAGWGIIVGAQAGETSVLTRAGHVIARAAGSALRGLEGGLGRHVLAWEPVAPSLAYGRGGWMELAEQSLAPHGWGLWIDDANDTKERAADA
ncbi:enolase C-terminal domain-like protein [Paraliomyxa miuraensis]|uniref:enolase C-terminal domain-like protein n=1 Tax=Paraliomyxa miuraensis TaxID=376150 RepID=UPI002254BE3E|nr:enolase C-terminal domain-like protein [Paraliomyxa miuraensis]MCX4241830.1 hypothetical protein [Paraliomyxa miuraensis]